MTELDRFTSAWAHLAWVDAWQGALLASFVWLLCRMWPSMPAHGRAWMWWLVGVKFVLGAIPTSGIPLPILPDSPLHLPFAYGLRFAGSPEIVQCLHMLGLLLGLVMFVIWVLGMVVNFQKAAHGWWHARLLRFGAVPVKHPAISFECRRLCFFVGIRPPLLLESDELTSPVLTGFFKPAIILPRDIIEDSKIHDARMMLAHELGHLKRRDLLFGWIPAIAQLLNWWNPASWMVSREWGLAQELACDEFAVHVTAALPLHFGQMLLAMTVAGRRPQSLGAPVVGLMGEHQTLKRRLIGMRHLGDRVRPGVEMMMRTLLVSVGFFLVPWHPIPRSEYRAPEIYTRTAAIVHTVCQTVGRDVALLTSREYAVQPPAVVPQAAPADLSAQATPAVPQVAASPVAPVSDINLGNPTVKPAAMIDNVVPPKPADTNNASVY